LAWLKMVVVKTDAQQTVPTLRRMRRKLVKFRALLMKCGEVIEVALAAMDWVMSDVLAKLRLPASLIDALREQRNIVTCEREPNTCFSRLVPP